MSSVLSQPDQFSAINRLKTRALPWLLRTTGAPLPQWLTIPAKHPHIRQRKQRGQLRRILVQAAKASFYIAKLAFAAPDVDAPPSSVPSPWPFRSCTWLCNARYVAQVLVSAASRSDLKNYKPPFIPWSFLNAGVARISAHEFTAPCSSCANSVTLATSAVVS